MVVNAPPFLIIEETVMVPEFQISAYPKDLASFLRERWQEERDQAGASLPDPKVLEHLISICYQASLLREEDRPVRFRVIFLPPDHFPPDLGPPAGLHRLLFKDKLPFTARELRKLSPSVDYYGSLIGLWHDDKNGLAVWGVVHSGMRWTQSLHGGGKMFQPLPASLVIHVTNPGRITVSKGSREIGSLNLGEVVSPSTGIFDAEWIRSKYVSIEHEELQLHTEAEKHATKPWATIDPEFFRMLKKQVIMRIIGRLRAVRHGGTLIFIPDEQKDEFLGENPYIKFKCRFVDEEPRRRFRTLIVKIANELAESYGSLESKRKVGWTEYLGYKNQTLSLLDESVFEWAHLVAGMAQVDGAVAITQQFELIGFGAEISGKLDRIDTVAKALDPEGSDLRQERTDCVGTRHHSAYSLCNSIHDVLSLVVSQDGTVQLARWNGGMVTIWDQLSPSLIDV
jgi:hypothetical protein